ncbi:hypothetical protein B0T19DRAFT_409315 [Cercophora scortea]|uniref:Uncharacterized protein n=1 Tax=Cercophora scortea TaxID=314031 RepID=A0AAE0J4H6_9PEZI|nr:hypothetical protein B0T19DRAFT_409315 [Cercophora scortea]
MDSATEDNTGTKRSLFINSFFSLSLIYAFFPFFPPFPCHLSLFVSWRSVNCLDGFFFLFVSRVFYISAAAQYPPGAIHSSTKVVKRWAG